MKVKKKEKDKNKGLPNPLRNYLTCLFFVAKLILKLSKRVNLNRFY